MNHRNYQPAKPGILAGQIIKAKRLRLKKNLCTPMVGDELLECAKAECQRSRLKYSDQGDFTTAYRGGFV